MITTLIRAESNISINFKIPILMAFIFMCQLSYAEDIKILFTKGRVHKKTAVGDLVPMLKGMRVIESDTIITGKNSFAVLSIKNHSIHRLEEKSKLLINHLPYFFKGTKEIEKPGVVELISGAIVSNIEKSKSHHSFKIKSASVVFGVRGTEFLVAYGESKDLHLAVNKGEVETYHLGTKFREFINKDESFFIEQGSNFTKKQKFDFHKTIDWSASNTKLKTTYNSLRLKIRKEFLEKRKSWSHDKKRIAQRISAFKAKKKNWEFRTKFLKSSPKLKIRKKQLEKFFKKKKLTSKDLDLRLRQIKTRDEEAKKRARMQLKQARRAKLRELQKLRRKQQLENQKTN